MARTIIDLSVNIDDSSPSEPWPAKIKRQTHREAAEHRASFYGIAPDEFPDGVHLIVEELNLITHVGTHIDAPYHYGPLSEGKPARTVDILPLEWFVAPGFILDVTHRKAGETVTHQDLAEALARIGYEIKPLDIALIRTDAAKSWGKKEYQEAHPGLTKEAVFWLHDRGVRIIGIDAYSLDKPFKVMAEEIKTKGVESLSPAHRAGRVKEYCQIEKLCNLDKIPKSHGFTVSCLPIKISGAGGAWTRAVAIID
ncbi:MAG: cyclase family protein [Firmicutes bacterium]|nr:cyclase family protein [Bacillota bacterium]